MKLREFIEKLEKMAKKYGDDARVIMADNVPVINLIFSKEYPDKNNVVVTDEE